MSRQEAEKQAVRVRAAVGEAEVRGALLMGKTMIEYVVEVPARTGFYAHMVTRRDVQHFLQHVEQVRAARTPGGA